ncbi:MAG: U32 family peptidase [Xanthobacteraceae bacterium]
MNAMPEIAMGPVLFNWQPEAWRDFYFRIADEAPVATVYVGETICSKRAPLFSEYFEAVIERLQRGGKTVILSTLGQVVQKTDRNLIDSICSVEELPVEANDVSALHALRGRPHYGGPMLNIYNGESLRFLAERGTRGVCVPAELSATTLAALCAVASELGVTIEAQVFGRISLALSARCYHARAHNRTKDSCLFVCENDPDGLELSTLDARSFLVINGIQTLSHNYLNLIGELPELQRMGVSGFRLSPHSCDMVQVAGIFHAVLKQTLAVEEATAQLGALTPRATFANGFYYGKPGHSWQSASPA